MQNSPSQQSELLEYLKQNPMYNSFLINTLETLEVDSCVKWNDSVAVHQKESGFWLMSLENRGDFKHLCENLDMPLGTFYVNDSAFFREIQEIIPDVHAEEYVQYVIGHDWFISDPRSINPEIEVVRIDKSWTDFILSLYHSKEFGYKEYIDRCIELNSGFGAIWQGKRVGYVTIHLDGEIGSMVISEYARGQGVGRTLMQHITPLYTSRASYGCGFVLPENRASKRMMENSCFRKMGKNIIWVYH